MSKYKVSVVIPIYNVEKYIEDTIKSIINSVKAIQNLSYFKKSLLLTLASNTIPKRKIKIWVTILSTYKV